MNKKLIMWCLAGVYGALLSNSVCAQSYRDKEIDEKFAAADVNHDGKLTLKEAQAGMPRVAEHFNLIDADHKGYVTLVQIKTLADK